MRQSAIISFVSLVVVAWVGVCCLVTVCDLGLRFPLRENALRQLEILPTVPEVTVVGLPPSPSMVPTFSFNHKPYCRSSDIKLVACDDQDKGSADMALLGFSPRSCK